MSTWDLYFSREWGINFLESIYQVKNTNGKYVDGFGLMQI
jgi:hypothetical protein